MVTFLLIIIYIAFIGLGIPDSLFGTAWPAIYSDLGLPISFANFVSVTVSLGTVFSSAMGAKIINKFGTSRVCAISTLLTAVSLIGFALSPNIWVMCIFSIPMGIGAGAIDVALNNYVALHYSATHMSFLHCFYGVGVSVSPFIMSQIINSSYGWRGGYSVAFILQIAIAVLLFATLPIWKKAHNQKIEKTEDKPKTLSFWQTLKIPGVWLMCALFIASCAIECTCGAYGSTFLVEIKHISVDKAANIIMIYYIGMTAGRFLSGVFASKMHSWTIIKIGQIILFLALIIVLIPTHYYVTALGLFFVGLGNGPLFPNFTYLAPQNFGKDVSQSVIGVQMALAYVSIMLTPTLCGILGQLISMEIFPFYLLIFFVLMIYATVRVKIVLKKNAK